MRILSSLRLLLAIGAAAAFIWSHASPAQQAPPPSARAASSESALDAILAILQANFADYLHSVPSFLCSEHVVSEVEPTPDPGGSRRTVTDATFRVRRTIGAEGLPSFSESRLLKKVDGKPPADDEETTELAAPMSVFGIFSGGLQLVSASGKACFQYRLHPTRKNHPGDKIVIDFDDLPARNRGPNCPTNGHASGRATVDPASRRVLRLESKTRDHRSDLGYLETWDWTVEYAPVVLSGKTFWMPASIRSRAIPDPASSDLATTTVNRRGASTMSSSHTPALTYSLDARYTDYHLLNVVSRIVPANGSDEPAPPAP